MEPTEGPRGKPRTFTVNLSFGRKPTPETAVAADAAQAEVTGAREHRSEWTKTYEFGAGHEDVPQPPPSDEEILEERLANLGHAYPDTAGIHNALRTITTVIAIGIPLAVFLLTLVTRQSSETVFFFTLGAILVAAMFKGVVR